MNFAKYKNENMGQIKRPKAVGTKDLKETLPLYPAVKKEGETTFSTLVRKRYGHNYYLIPMVYKGETEAKAIHGLHSEVHKYLMLGIILWN